MKATYWKPYLLKIRLLGIPPVGNPKYWRPGCWKPAPRFLFRRGLSLRRVSCFLHGVGSVVSRIVSPVVVRAS